MKFKEVDQKIEIKIGSETYDRVKTLESERVVLLYTRKM